MDDLANFIYVRPAVSLANTKRLLHELYNKLTPAAQGKLIYEFDRIKRGDQIYVQNMKELYDKGITAQQVEIPYDSTDFPDLNIYQQYNMVLSAACERRLFNSIKEGGLELTPSMCSIS